MARKTSKREPKLCLDVGEHCLTRGSHRIALTPRLYDLLLYLVRNPGRLLSKAEILQAVWPSVHVGEASVKNTVRALRQLLGDKQAAPRIIETVRGHGYRFVGDIGLINEKSAQPRPQTAMSEEADGAVWGTPDLAAAGPIVVGRVLELKKLEESFALAAGGQTRVVLITGEAGIGKTTLAGAFTGRLQRSGAAMVAVGRCVEHLANNEPYLPLLDAVSSLCEGQARGDTLACFHRFAPSWLLQLPWLLEGEERDILLRRSAGIGVQRMLREFARAIEKLTEARPLVLWLEDLHACDPATAALVSYLCTALPPCRFLLIATCRHQMPGSRPNALASVLDELPLKGRCEELSLSLFSAEAISDYLDLRYGSPVMSRGLVPLLTDLTGGNVLFVVSLVEHWEARGAITQEGDSWIIASPEEKLRRSVPQTLRRLIESQVDRLDPGDRALLEAMSVIGVEVSAVSLAIAMVEDRTATDYRCRDLAERTPLLRSAGRAHLPGNQISSKYRLTHGLYQKILYDRTPVGDRAAVHKRVSEGMEALYGDRAPGIALDLAYHFENSGDLLRAGKYLIQGAQQALARSVPRQALDLASKALNLLEKAGPEAEDEDRTLARMKLSLLLIRGVSSSILDGYASGDADAAYQQALQLAQSIGAPDIIPQALFGLWTGHFLRGEIQLAAEIGERLHAAAEASGEAEPRILADLLVVSTSVHSGDLGRGRSHLDSCLKQYDSERYAHHTLRNGADTAVLARGLGSWACWIAGQPEEALGHSRAAAALAEELGYPVNRAVAFAFDAILHQIRGDHEKALDSADQGIAISKEYDFAQWATISSLVRGWARARAGEAVSGVEEIQAGLARWREIGSGLDLPRVLTLLAEAHGLAGQDVSALQAAQESLAVATHTGERLYEAETLRLRGRLLEKAKDAVPAGEVENCYHSAMKTAAAQGATLFELRAANDLVAFQRRRGNGEDATGVLRAVLTKLEPGILGHDLAEVSIARRILAGAW